MDKDIEEIKKQRAFHDILGAEGFLVQEDRGDFFEANGNSQSATATLMFGGKLYYGRLEIGHADGNIFHLYFNMKDDMGGL